MRAPAIMKRRRAASDAAQLLLPLTAFEAWGKFRAMKRPTKTKRATKKAAKKPATGRAASAKTPTKGASVKSPPRPSRPPAPRAEPYAPKPIQGVGWPAFRYPLQ
jgi:hypothetical protein